MSETIEYLGTIIKNCTTLHLTGSEIVWQAGETVIIKEIKDIRYYRIMKLLNRSTSMVRGRNKFKYYEPVWLEIRRK
jgi:hypothetical protein